MSRKWKRMVEKNRKQLNEKREKQGKGRIGMSHSDYDLYRGRSQVLPLFLLTVALFFAFSSFSWGGTDALFWVTFASYILLSLYFYFFKRPYLKIGKSYIATRKWGREIQVNWSEVNKITYSPGNLIISVKGQRTDWFFSRTLNRYETEEMAEKLEKLAEQHRISFEKKL